MVLDGVEGGLGLGRGTGGGTGGRSAEDLSTERRLRHTIAFPMDGPSISDPIPPPTNTTPPTTTDTDTTPPPPAKQTPAAQFQITAKAGGATASIAGGHGGGSCTGANVGNANGPGTTVGCAPPPPNSDHILTVVTDGTSVPPQQIRLP